MMQFDFKEAFNRFSEEADRETDQMIEAICKKGDDDLISHDEMLIELINAKATYVGYLVIKVMNQYHQELMKYLDDKLG